MGKPEFEPESLFVGGKGHAAALLCRTDHGGLHSGLLYRTAGGGCGVIHLGWEDMILTTWEWERYWATPEVEPELLASVGALCRLILKRYVNERRFPYALRFDGTTFDSAGRLVLGPDSKGLTCATFVLAVFDGVGVRMVDEASWPSRPDKDKEFLEAAARFARPAHLEVLKAEVESGVRRIHPHEVLGACGCIALPAAFDSAEPLAKDALGRLDERRSTVSGG